MEKDSYGYAFYKHEKQNKRYADTVRLKWVYLIKTHVPKDKTSMLYK